MALSGYLPQINLGVQELLGYEIRNGVQLNGWHLSSIPTELAGNRNEINALKVLKTKQQHPFYTTIEARVPNND
ncbi:hypothetical protein TNCV_3775771 [Trichonephila clavipes]|nr:hypothetical protein TNCV_3775771 [Trichonephila clavipes]